MATEAGIHAGASAVSGEAPVVAQPAIDPVLVDDELAEHERWGSAAATVGAAGSTDRAGWVAEQVGGGLGSGALWGAGAGLALTMTTRAASRLAVRRIPVPVVGAIIGGSIGAISLFKQVFNEQDRAEVLGKLGAIGEGASGYEVAANTIDGIVAGLDVAGNLLDTVAALAGAIAAIAWLLAVPTLGSSIAVATPATAVATAASVGGAVVGAIKMLLQPLVLLFRSLHTFTSEADPRAVQATGGQLAGDAEALGGVLGGFAGNAAGGKASDRLGLPEDPNRAARAADATPAGRASAHPEGPVVEARRPLVLTEEELQVAELMAANPNGTVLDQHGQVAAGGPLPGATTPTPGLLDQYGNPIGASTPQIVGLDGKPVNGKRGQPALDVDDAVIAAALNGEQPDVARRIAHTIQPDPSDPTTIRPRSEFDPEPTELELRIALGGMGGHGVIAYDPPLPSLGYGHGHLVDPEGNPIPSTLGSFRGETGQPAVDPDTGKTVWDPNAKLHLPGTGDYKPEAAFGVRVGQPGSWVDGVFDGDRDAALKAAIAHAQARALAGQEAIADDSALPRGWAPQELGQVPKENEAIDVMNVYEIDPATPRLVSTVAPQPEGRPGPGLPAVYPGGGPQAQLPRGTIGWPPNPVASIPVQKQPWTSTAYGGAFDTIDGANDASSLSQLVKPDGPAPPSAAPVGAAPAAPAGPEQRRVVPVDPAYERPPGTLEELTAMRGEIGTLLVCQAQADADTAAAQADRTETDRRASQLTSVVGGVEALDSRTAAQGSAVADTAAANQQQQGRQAQAGSSLDASASRLAGLATLETLLGGWAAVTYGIGKAVSLVSDSGAAKMEQLNGDAVRFMQQLAQAKVVVSGQSAQHPLQTGKLAGDATAIGGEATRTTATGATVDRSRKAVDALGVQNASDSAAAAEAEARAKQDAADAAGAATDVQARHDQLAADLAAWAERHREQRRQAVEATRARLEAEGYEVTNASPW